MLDKLDKDPESTEMRMGKGPETIASLSFQG